MCCKDMDDLVPYACLANLSYANDITLSNLSEIGFNDIGIKISKIEVLQQGNRSEVVGWVFEILPKREVICVFRGTDSINDCVQHNLQILPIDYAINGTYCGKVHQGFLHYYTKIRAVGIINMLNKAHARMVMSNTSCQTPPQFTFVGHSLGGVVVLCALEFFEEIESDQDAAKRIKCVTFGAPALGDKALKQYVNKRIPDIKRLVYSNDIVPNLPSVFHQHVVDPIVIDAHDDSIPHTKSIFCERFLRGVEHHNIKRYIEGIRRGSFHARIHNKGPFKMAYKLV
jgi:hypothetical protein